MENRIILSNRLISVLSQMKHQYAKVLIEAHNNKESVLENSYIDFDKADGMVSWLPNGKDICHATKKELPEKDKWSKGRQQVAVGKVIRAILQKKEINFIDKEIELFVNEYKTTQNPYTFKLVKGKDITKYYNMDTYDLSYYNEDGQNPGRSLYGSCMRHDKCKSFFNIYENFADVSMLCLFNEKQLLIGRALIWDNVIIENVGKVTFMDRVYTMDTALEEIFKNHAVQKGWWFKIRQGTNQETHIPFREISDGVKVNNDPKLMIYVPTTVDYTKVRKPYIDTMRFFGYKLEGENLLPVLSSHRNDKDRSPKDLNWLERWDRLDGTAQGNGHYHRKRDMFNKMLPKKPFIKYENGYYWSDIETAENIFDGGYFTESFNTVLVLFDKNDKPVAFMAMNHESDYNHFVMGDKIKSINKKKLAKEYNSYVVDVLTHSNVRIGNVDGWIKNNKNDRENFNISDVLEDSLNEKMVKEKPELFKGPIDYYNTSQVRMMAKFDVTVSQRLTVKNVIDFAKTGVLDESNIGRVANKFNMFYGEGKLWLVLTPKQIEELITFGMEPAEENLKIDSDGNGLLELKYDWDYSTGEFLPSKEFKKGDIVKLRPGCQHFHQSQGTQGIVTESNRPGSSNVRVNWKNGNGNTYTYADLLVQKTGSTFEIVRTYIKKIKKKMVWINLTDDNIVGVDTKVKIKIESKFYGQAPELIGTITQVLNREPWEEEYYPYNVVWSNGEENGYRSCDLVAEV